MEDTSALSLQSLWRAIRQRWLTLLFTSALLFAAIAAYVFTLQARLHGRGRGAARARSPKSWATRPPRRGCSRPPIRFSSAAKPTIIGSDELSREVIEKLELAQQAEFLPAPGLLEQLGIRRAHPPARIRTCRRRN